MRKQIKCPFANHEERIVNRFLFLPKTLLLPSDKRTSYTTEEWRWLERANIIQFYSHWNECWLNLRWANKLTAAGREREEGDDGNAIH